MKINLKKLTKQQIALLVVIAVVVLAVIGAVIYFWPYISSLQEEENQKIFQDWVRSFGPWGIIILLVIGLYLFLNLNNTTTNKSNTSENKIEYRTKLEKSCVLGAGFCFFV